jgi:glycosyltransferase involved in cell wall biosynthesis
VSYPPLTVVTICYNDAPGLRQTVASIDEQALPPYEHIIVDGASLDETIDYLNGIQSKPYRVVISEPDEGIYDAMNKGMRLASGEYLIFMNSGDRFSSPTILSEVGQLLAESRPNWAYGRSWMEWPDHPAHHDLGSRGALRFFTGRATVPHQATVVRTEFAKHHVGEFRTDLGLSSDQHWLMRAWMLSRPIYLDKTIAICDATGIGSIQKVGELSRQVYRNRKLNGVRLIGSPLLNLALLGIGLALDHGISWGRSIRNRGRK